MLAPPSPMSATEATSPTPEENRFLQKRVALFGLVGFLLSASGTLLTFGLSLSQGTTKYAPQPQFQALTVMMPLLAWALCRGEKARSPGFVRAVEIMNTLGFVFGFQTVLLFWPTRSRPDLLAALVAQLVVITRAIFVPSSTKRTAVLSLAATAPLPFIALYVHHAGRETMFFDIPPAVLLANAIVWVIVSVGLSSATSNVIYGLRKAVRKAQELGQYTLMEKLGEGGMGQVFKARHAMLRRPTAVKLLHTSSPEELASFEREVQLTAQLSHPNTVTIFDYGRTPDGVFYYAMELLDGSDLQRLVESHGPMPPARVIHILSQVAAALAEAHAVGLIHRDIKPANIMLCARGTSRDVAKLVDFGLVKPIEGVGDAAMRDAGFGDGASKTPFGEGAVGTPLYIAPETILAKSGADGRTDLYSLGGVAYFLLTGTPVFQETTLSATLGAHVRSAPEPPSARLGRPLPSDLEAIVLACLAKDPSHRPRDAGSLGEALRACRDANRWSESDASRWWSTAATTRPARSADHVSWSARTIAVDLERPT